MKIKSDFVTNSSSTAYVILDSHPKGRKKFVKKILDDTIKSWAMTHKNWAIGGGMRTFETIDDLDFYTNGDRPVDWAQKPKGPRFLYFLEEEYNEYRKYIEQGKRIHYLKIDNNASDLSRYFIEAKFLSVLGVEDL